MCGIAGFIDRGISEGLARARLDAMLNVIRHRGPDGHGSFHHPDSGLSMGMRRLSIIDLEGGHQPIWNEDNTVGIVFNGEIYNYLELAPELVRQGHVLHTHSDTEVLVHLYEQYGVEMFRHLRGMFGFAIYDAKRQKLLIARDHFGQKPMYLYRGGNRLAFGSELKSLLMLPYVPRDLDDDAFLDYVSWGSVPAPRTHFTHIQKLPAGSYLWIDLKNPAAAEPVKFWRYTATPRPEITDMDTALQQLDGLLTDSLRLHLRADVPIGVLLSSGIDSRCIAAYAQDQVQGSLSTFTVGFYEGDVELVGAAKTAGEIKSRHHALQLDASDMREGIEEVAWHLDEPVGDPAAFAVLRVCRFAREHVKVLLGGEGSDELFGGYAGRYQGMIQTILKSGYMRSLAPFLVGPNQAYPSSRFGRLRRRARRSRGAEIVALRIEQFPGDVRKPRGLTPQQLLRLLRREEEIAAQLYRPQRDLLSEITAMDVDWQLADSLLLKADKMSMGASIELRSPMLDVNLADFAAKLHPSLKMGDTGPGKLVLRKTLGRKIHEDLLRPKMGFPVPKHKWFRGPLKGDVEAAVFGSNSPVLERLDAGLLRAAWNDFQGGVPDLERGFYSLWLYAAWHRKITGVVPVA